MYGKAIEHSQTTHILGIILNELETPTEKKLAFAMYVVCNLRATVLMIIIIYLLNFEPRNPSLGKIICFIFIFYIFIFYIFICINSLFIYYNIK